MGDSGLKNPETTATPPGLASHLEQVRDAAENAGVFGGTEIRDGQLICRALASAEPASYRILFDGGRLWVSLVMADRWLSESIEADLMHTGDKLEDLLNEELIEQGFTTGPLPYEHFRSDDLLFTFRSPIPVAPSALGTPDAVRPTVQCLLAYEACFRNLGDMEADEE